MDDHYYPKVLVILISNLRNKKASLNLWCLFRNCSSQHMFQESCRGSAKTLKVGEIIKKA